MRVWPSRSLPGLGLSPPPPPNPASRVGAQGAELWGGQGGENCPQAPAPQRELPGTGDTHRSSKDLQYCVLLETNSKIVLKRRDG